MEKFSAVGSERHSEKMKGSRGGDIYFIASIVILCGVFSYSNRILYYIPLLILIFPDALAALGGMKFGKIKYKSVVGEKSVEGSAIFYCNIINNTGFTSSFLQKQDLDYL